MAKQGINPIEQHVEKIVLGVSALLFLFVVFSYIISTPITVVVNSQRISPYELDRHLGDAADNLARLYKNASFKPPTVDPNAGSGTEKGLVDLRQNLQALDKMPATMASPVGWWPQMQKLKGGPGEPELPTAHGIASISAPTISEVQTGVTYAGVVAQPVNAFNDPKGLDAVARLSQSGDFSRQDVTWAFVKMNFDEQQQYEIFRQNGYSQQEANIILFTDVQLQRQRVYPNGSTGSWEDVDTYKTVSLKSAPATIEVSTDGTMGQLDDQRVRQLFAVLGSAQTSLLYPLPLVLAGDGFPPYMAEGVQQPISPDLLDGSRMRPPGPAQTAAPVRPPVRAAAPSAPRSSGGSRGGTGGGSRSSGGSRAGGGGGRGAEPPRSGGGGGRGADPFHGGGGGYSGAGAAAARPAADPAAMQALNKAEQAYKQKRYTEAMRFLEQARAGAGQQPRFQKLETEILAAYQAWQLEEGKRLQEHAAEGARNAEIWAYDLHAQPGKTYRYRSRAVLFNVFSHPDIDRTELKNPQDAAQVSLTGEWSEPSQPVTIASPLCFFLAGASSSGDSATIDLFRFQQGQWFTETAHVAPGEEIGDLKPKDPRTNRPEIDFHTHNTVVDIGLDPVAVVETETTGDPYKVRKASCPVLVYMDDDGTIHQRWSARDSKSQLKKELSEFWVKRTAEQLQAGAQTAAPTGGTRAATAPASPGARGSSSPAAATGMPGR